MSCCDAVVTGTCLTGHISHVLYRNLHIAENRVRHTQAQSGVFAGDPVPCPPNPPRFTPRGGSTPPPGTSLTLHPRKDWVTRTRGTVVILPVILFCLLSSQQPVFIGGEQTNGEHNSQR